ncbi:MAG: DNA mismatch repair protein MutS [candidate division Zixibacteria bacterium SM23_81]|nr:MAG: DNA mismatch repair protein MutS [candidate division Zixibacteria bacterium SM23_81]
MADLTPMMAQYNRLKRKYKDCIFFFRMGDFYEMFNEDAKIASRILGITLTSRSHGKAKKIPLAGVPWHAAEGYLARLIKAGYKVAICEQVEDSARAKGIVKREVVQVVTPGTTVSERILSHDQNNYLLAINQEDGTVGLAIVDLSTGEFELEEMNDRGLTDELQRLFPAEILLPSSRERDLVPKLRRLLPAVTVTTMDDWRFSYDDAYESLISHFQTISLKGFGCENLKMAVGAAGAALNYLKENQKAALSHIRGLATVHPSDYMMLDATTLRNLEVLAPLREELKEATLFSVLNRTKTPMGTRLLSKWLRKPLLNGIQINSRLEGVEELAKSVSLRLDIAQSLKRVVDMERLVARVGCGRANARDLNALKCSLKIIPEMKTLLKVCSSQILKEIGQELDAVTAVVKKIEQAIVDEPPLAMNEGGLIRAGYHLELDQLRQISKDGKNWIAQLQRRERGRTGIKSLKVGYNRVFGYYIEVTKPNLSLVPDDYFRKQTMANAERFITPELKEQEAKVLGAEDRIKSMEYDLFVQVRSQIAEAADKIQQNARLLARLDVLASLATVAVENDYRRPTVNDEDQISIRDGRHPVVEKLMQGEEFISNDTQMDHHSDQILIITGPNMAGKSTYLRQVGLIVLLAQMGSFVPAKEAKIGIVDRIFTRVGAMDSLATGESTFLVEMNETTNILNNATPRSLLLLDEIGRGTSTFDGLSIAWAVAEYIHNTPSVSAKTLFATHYHELTELALILPRVKNYNVAVREWQDHIVFLRKIVEGSCDHSYGIQVARLAGLPNEVIERAQEVLANLEDEELTPNKIPKLAIGPHAPPMASSPQLSLFVHQEHPVIREIKKLEINKITPLEALNILHQLMDKMNSS